MNSIRVGGSIEMLNEVEGGVSNPDYDFDDYDLLEELTERKEEVERLSFTKQ